MPEVGRLTRVKDGAVIVEQVRWCASFFCKLRGLMFRRELREGEGLLLVEALSSRTATAIHMLFMAFPIAVIWLDADFCVVDKVVAHPWRLVYAPAQPARYTLETAPAVIDRVEVGDLLQFKAVSA